MHRSSEDPGSATVSVIVPLFNRARLLPFTLGALSANDHPGVGVEIIVVDDGSVDGGADVARRMVPGAVVLDAPRIGAAAARNLGLSRANGEFVLLLDSDDLVEPGFFAPRIAALRTHPTAAAAYGPFDLFRSDAGFREELVEPRRAAYPIDPFPTQRPHLLRLLAGWYIPPATILWRAAALRALRGQDETLGINQDVDLLFRALVLGDGIVGCVGPRGLYRQHSTPGRQGVVAGDATKAEDMLRLHRRFAADLERHGLLDSETRESLAAFCFYRWFEFRRLMPAIAEGFYELSRSLDSRIHIPGRWPLRFLSATLGARQAMILSGAMRQAGSHVRRIGQWFPSRLRALAS